MLLLIMFLMVVNCILIIVLFVGVFICVWVSLFLVDGSFVCVVFRSCWMFISCWFVFWWLFLILFNCLRCMVFNVFDCVVWFVLVCLICLLSFVDLCWRVLSWLWGVKFFMIKGFKFVIFLEMIFSCFLIEDLNLFDLLICLWSCFIWLLKILLCVIWWFEWLWWRCWVVLMFLVMVVFFDVIVIGNGKMKVLWLLIFVISFVFLSRSVRYL